MDSQRDPAPVEEAVQDYYEALRRGEPLYSYFEEEESVAKFGIGEAMHGYDAVAEGLREQTRTTDEWRVESHALSAGRDGDGGWFSDHVELAWREDGNRRDHDTRWSGSLRRRDEEWVFSTLHVSVAVDPATGRVAASNPDDR